MLVLAYTSYITAEIRMIGMKELFERSSLRRLIIDVLFTLVGSFLVALSLSMFTIPNDIAPGGVSGLSTALAHITPIRVSLWSLILNVPLLLCAWRILGLRSLVLTLISTVLLSVFIDLSDLLLPAYTNNALLSAVFGGVISGAGVGVLFLRGISTGGSDLLALLLKKRFPNVPSGTMLLLIDAAVVIIASAVFQDIEVVLYSAIAIVISSKVIDAMAEGVDYAKVIYIVTNKGDEVSKALNTYTDRGTTIVPATGGYTGGEKQIIITVTRRNVLSQTLRVIKLADPESFTFVMDSTEVHGEGFKRDAIS